MSSSAPIPTPSPVIYPRAESSGRKWSAFASSVVTDAHQRLASEGVELTDYEMISWAAIYFRLKVDESGRAGFFNILRALAVSEAACELEFLPPLDEVGEEEPPGDVTG